VVVGCILKILNDAYITELGKLTPSAQFRQEQGLYPVKSLQNEKCLLLWEMPSCIADGAPVIMKMLIPDVG
jgi:hypothetical protein